jgi:hypothetical protein
MYWTSGIFNNNEWQWGDGTPIDSTTWAADEPGAGPWDTERVLLSNNELWSNAMTELHFALCEQIA